MSREFVNLPSNYKKFLDSVVTLFNNEILEKLAKEDLSFKEISKLHDDIESVAESNNCSSYDINRMINSYKKENSIIEILRKISSLRNKYIVYYSQKSNLWNENLKKIKEKYKLAKNKSTSLSNIETSFIKILKKYKYDWDGLWSVIEISNKGNIKKIDLFDLEDLDELINSI